MHSINIDLEKCTKCKTCLNVCFQDVLRWDDEKGIVRAAYPQDCHACCLCELLCPANAIKVVPDWSDVYWPPVIAKRGR
jgi:NAD-dependent dihydropyrimidine dehydrogenase PreA subunit